MSVKNEQNSHFNFFFFGGVGVVIIVNNLIQQINTGTFYPLCFIGLLPILGLLLFIHNCFCFSFIHSFIYVFIYLS